MINNRNKKWFDNPYWIGTGCDINDGAEFLIAEELLETKAYGSRFIKEAWENVCVLNLSMTPLDVWFDSCSFKGEVVEKNGIWRLAR